MRCPSCNKFVPYDEPECEVQGSDINESTASIEVRVVLKCAECGEELKDCDMEAEAEIDHECEKKKGKEDPEFTFVDDPCEAESSDRYETVDRKGKPIKNPRYQKHYYGFTANAEVVCVHCKETVQLEFSAEEQASGFNELV